MRHIYVIIFYKYVR